MSTVWLDEQQFRTLSAALDIEDKDGFRVMALDITLAAGVDVTGGFHPNLWLCMPVIDNAEGRFALTTDLFEEP